MKKINLILIIALFIGTVSVSAQKIGHINSAELLSLMPQTKLAQETLNTSVGKKKDALEKLQAAFETKAKAWQTKVEAMSEADRQKNRASLESEQQALQKEAQTIEENRKTYADEVAKEQETLYKPIEEKAIAAINKVAAAKALEYVFDTSAGGLVVAKGYDLLSDVKKELGIQ